jgi:DNA-binding MarR family transcriptional regulator
MPQIDMLGVMEASRAQAPPNEAAPAPPDEAAPAPPDEAEGFLGSFDALAQAIRRARGAQATQPEDALTLSQFGLLQPLSDCESARVRDLACEAGIAPSTATRILDALERRAIISRRRSEDDRRGVTVRLTRFGREALCRQNDWMRGRQRAFYEGLPDTERELAPDLLVRLAALIDELAAGPG